jgi:hypothetical protein
MLPHLGQANNCPTAFVRVTRSFAAQVSQRSVNSSNAQIPEDFCPDKFILTQYVPWANDNRTVNQDKAVLPTDYCG